MGQYSPCPVSVITPGSGCEAGSYRPFVGIVLMDMSLIIQLVAGLIGGNAAGSALKNLNMGPILNSVVGLLGGVGGGQILSMLGMGGAGEAAAAATSSGLDISSIIQSVVGGGAGGGILVAIVGAIKKALVK